MSIRLMTMIWASGPADSTDKLVLLALADYANDAFECWPSIDALAAKCSLKERGTRQIIRRLEAAGWLSVVVGGGRHACNRYTINPAPHAPLVTDKPGTTCPVQSAERGHSTTERGHSTTLNPAPHAPEPSRTIKEPAAAAAREQEEPTYRERILTACGVRDVGSGITGPDGRILGRAADMAVADRWLKPAPAGFGLTVDQVVTIIAERVSKMRGPPGSFSYFDGAMADFASARDRPIPIGNPAASRPDPAVDRWNRLAAPGKHA